MKTYISNVNAFTSSIYGDYKFSIGIEVPEIYALKFPQYVTCIETIETVEETVEEVKEIVEQTKKQRRFINE